MQQRRELRVSLLVDAAVLFEAVAYAGAKLVDRPFGTGYADDRHVEKPAAHQRVQRRVELFVREIACRAEQDECVRPVRHSAHSLPFVDTFSRCPPNSRRIADRMRLANSARCRELKRSY